jgi:hypothetical protein
MCRGMREDVPYPDGKRRGGVGRQEGGDWKQGGAREGFLHFGRLFHDFPMTQTLSPSSPTQSFTTFQLDSIPNPPLRCLKTHSF